MTGNKLLQKRYYRHSGYPGGLKEESLQALIARKPELVIERAVKGMLPQNRLGRAMYQEAEGLRRSRITHTRRSSPQAFEL